jgi:hypothetical protein
MKGALAVVAIEVLDRANEPVMHVAAASEPFPYVTIEPIAEGDIQITGVTARVHLRGTVHDPLADITPDHAADIDSVRIGMGSFTAPVTAGADDVDLDPLRRPHAFKGTFDTHVVINLGDNANRIVVEATNAIGNVGSATAILNADWRMLPTSSDPFDRDPGVFPTFAVSAGVSPADPRHLTVTYPSERVEGEVTLIETAERGSFIGALHNEPLKARLTIAPETSVPARTAIVRLSGGGGAGEATVNLVEDAGGTSRFMPVTDRALSIQITDVTAQLTFEGQIMALTRGADGLWHGIGPDGPVVALIVGDVPRADRIDVLGIELQSGFTPQDVPPIKVPVEETAIESNRFVMLTGEAYRRPGTYRGVNYTQSIEALSVSMSEESERGINEPYVVRVRYPVAWQPQPIYIDDVAAPYIQESPGVRRLRDPLMFLHQNGLEPTVAAVPTVQLCDPGSGEIRFGNVAGRVVGQIWSCDHPDDLPKIGAGLSARLSIHANDVNLTDLGEGEWTMAVDPAAGLELVVDGDPVTRTVMIPRLWRDPIARTTMEWRVIADATSASVKQFNPGPKFENPNLHRVAITRGGKRLDKFKVVEVVRPRIITLCVDGLGDHWFRKALEKSPDLAALFGKNGSRAVVRTAQSVLPSITWANWAGVFTGLEPKDHGVYGNSFFRRDQPNEEPIFSGNDFEGALVAGTKDGDAGKAGIGKDGLCFLLRTGVKTTYDEAATLEPQPRTESNMTWYPHGASNQKVYFSQLFYPSTIDPELAKPVTGSGATCVIIPELEPPTKEFLKKHTLDELNWAGAAGQMINGHEPSGLTAQYTDAYSVSRLVESWRTSYPPVLTTVYLPGPDNFGHANAKDYGYEGMRDLESGNRSPYKHFVGYTARWLRLFHERHVVQTGWAGATIYLLVSDHGQTVTTPEGHPHEQAGAKKGLWVVSKSKGEKFEKNVHLRHFHEDDENSKVEQLVQVVDAVNEATRRGLAAWMRRDENDHRKRSVIFSPNGGLAFIYVSGTVEGSPPWSQMPQTRVSEIAKAIYQCALGNYSPRGQIVYPGFSGALGPDPAIIVRDTAEWEGEASGKLKVLGIDQATGRFALRPLATLDGKNQHWVNTARRIDGLDDYQKDGAAARCPDIILIMNTGGGWNAVHEGDVLPGWHGGPSQADSLVPFALGFNGLELGGRNEILRQTIATAESSDSAENPTGLQNRHMHYVMLELLRKLKGTP